jgi:hypothetical protein
MPRETIRLGLSMPFTSEPGATLLSFLAYPNSKNAMMRAEFWLAICRFAVTAMCENDRDWANSPQAIRPIISLMGDTDRRKALRLGSTQLGYRFKAAAFFAMPHLIAEFRGCELIKYEGFAPTVENLAVLAKHRMGWDRDRDGTSTIKSRIWGPSRPVIHAAAILLFDGIARRGISSPENPESWLPYLKDPELLLPVLRASELARLLLPRIKQFRIRETDTVEFLP